MWAWLADALKSLANRWNTCYICGEVRCDKPACREERMDLEAW